MPNAPARLCSRGGCRGLVRNGVCSLCGIVKGNRNYGRKTAAERGYDYEWTQYSLAYRKHHPLCAICLRAGRTTPAELVDHIKEVSGPDDPLFWEPSNHQAACRECHEKKHGRKK